MASHACGNLLIAMSTNKKKAYWGTGQRGVGFVRQQGMEYAHVHTMPVLL
jgi:hypothetical protein